MTAGPPDVPIDSASEPADVVGVLRSVVEHERQARDALIRARDDLVARDDRFAVIEAELWAGVEQRERAHRDRVAELERRIEEAHEQLARQRTADADELIRLRVRLDRIVGSAPYRAYRHAQRLPGLRAVRGWRIRAYERAVSARGRD